MNASLDSAARHDSAAPLPRVLLAHHPETFTQAQPHSIGLTLAGHTHGGGQIVLGHVDGQPIGVSALRFHYRSGLYQKDGLSLYVNRGLGYMGLPIRINCLSDVSQVRLPHAYAAGPELPKPPAGTSAQAWYEAFLKSSPACFHRRILKPAELHPGGGGPKQ